MRMLSKDIFFAWCCAFVLGLAAKTQASTAQAFIDRTVAAIQVLNNEWYNYSTGTWGFFEGNFPEIVTTLATFGALGVPEVNHLGLSGYIKNTYTHQYNNDLLKYSYLFEGIWAMALVRSYDFTTESVYINSAISLFDDIHSGSSSGGGILVDKTDKFAFRKPLVNLLYLSLAASLASRVQSPENTTYRDIAVSQWGWLQRSGMLDGKGLVRDSTDASLDYSPAEQGEILGALSELAQGTGDFLYLETASNIAWAAIQQFSSTKNGAGLLQPKCGSHLCESENGYFIRNLGHLWQKLPLVPAEQFILSNAESIWQHDRNSKNMLGENWEGPYERATTGSHINALNALVAAAVLSLDTK